MALTELQLPNKVDLYNTLSRTATDINRYMVRWGELAEMINTIETADLDSMSIPTGQVRTDLIAFKNTLNELVAFFDGASTSQTNVPESIVNKIRAIK